MIEKVIRQYLGWAKKITQHPIFLITESSNFSVLFHIGFWRMGEGSVLRRMERVMAICSFYFKSMKIVVLKEKQLDYLHLRYLTGTFNGNGKQKPRVLTGLIESATFQY